MNVALERHTAAAAVLKRNEEYGTPFVLMLRTYTVPFIVTECKYAPAPFDFQDFVYDNIHHGVGVVSIRGSHWYTDTLEFSDHPTLHTRCPALIVPNDEWKSMATALIKYAAVIVCEAHYETDGFCWELEECKAQKREHDTVVILPDPNELWIRRILYTLADSTGLFSRMRYRTLIFSITLRQLICFFVRT